MLKTYKIVTDTSKGIWCLQYFLVQIAFTSFYPVYIPVFCFLNQLKGTQHNTQKVLFIWNRGFLWFQTPPNIFVFSECVSYKPPNYYHLLYHVPWVLLLCFLSFHKPFTLSHARVSFPSLPMITTINELESWSPQRVICFLTLSA